MLETITMIMFGLIIIVQMHQKVMLKKCADDLYNNCHRIMSELFHEATLTTLALKTEIKNLKQQLAEKEKETNNDENP